jgi:hypothetical protein
MALPYPTGEVFFKRSALHGGCNPAWFNANKREAFERNILFKYLWNVPDHPPFNLISSKYKDNAHLSAELAYSDRDPSRLEWWRDTYFMFAKDKSSKYERRSVVKHHDSYGEYDNVRDD